MGLHFYLFLICDKQDQKNQQRDSETVRTEISRLVIEKGDLDKALEVYVLRCT